MIAHECGFEKISFLKFIPNLNTLILSKNSISDFSVTEVGSFAHLTKLSIGHNMLKFIPDLSASVNLTELRIGHNLITTISDSILHNKKLKTLDLSHNLLSDWENVKILVGLPNLTNLGLKDNNFPPPPESTDELEVREDNAAEGIEDIIERRFRRFVLSIFLRVVGIAGKSFEQLIVLDMKRVKMKLTPGMSTNMQEEGEREADMNTTKNKGKKSVNTIKNDKFSKDRFSNKKNSIEVEVKLDPIDEIKQSEKIINKKSSEKNSVMKDSDENNKEIKSSKNTPKRRSLDQSVEEEVTSDLKSLRMKKKKKIEKVENLGFLSSNDNEKLKTGNEPKSVKVLSSIPASQSSSGVLSLVVHKKTVKVDDIKSNSNKEINNNEITKVSIPIATNIKIGKIGNKKIKNIGSQISLIIDDVSVSSVLAGNNSYVVGTGGDSAW